MLVSQFQDQKFWKKACANSSIKHDLELRPQFNIRVTMVVEFKNQTAKRIKPCYNWQFSNTVHQQLNITELNQKFDVSVWVGPELFGTHTLVSHCLETENDKKICSLVKLQKSVFRFPNTIERMRQNVVESKNILEKNYTSFACKNHNTVWQSLVRYVQKKWKCYISELKLTFDLQVCENQKNWSFSLLIKSS